MFEEYVASFVLSQAQKQPHLEVKSAWVSQKQEQFGDKSDYPSYRMLIQGSITGKGHQGNPANPGTPACLRTSTHPRTLPPSWDGELPPREVHVVATVG